MHGMRSQMKKFRKQTIIKSIKYDIFKKFKKSIHGRWPQMKKVKKEAIIRIEEY